LDPLRARIVIVGAGQAGARAAEACRAAGHRGELTLIGEEEHLPYERPQLSKTLLVDSAAAPAFIRPIHDWNELDVTLLTSARAISIDAEKRRVGLADGQEVAFDRLLLTTGTRARKLRDIEGAGVPTRYLRSIADALALRDELRPGRKIVLVGGGVIGLEVAAAAAIRGCHITIIEKADSLLAQAGSPTLSRYAHRLHAAKGVEIICGATIARSVPDGLQLDDSNGVAADLLLIGVGVEPNADLVDRMGLPAQNGVRITQNGKTAFDGIYAAGDVAEQWSRSHDRWMRIENWANAQNQAIATAKTMVGLETDYDAPPWFWSDQYDTNIQVLGNPAGGAEIVRGDIASGRFTTISVRDGEVIGAVTVNAAKDMAILRRLVASRKTVRQSDLENPAYELKRSLAA
jgi:p-cumate 2,3-dioxygenase ferredoxin reductase component